MPGCYDSLLLCRTFKVAVLVEYGLSRDPPFQRFDQLMNKILVVIDASYRRRNYVKNNENACMQNLLILCLPKKGQN